MSNAVELLLQSTISDMVVGYFKGKSILITGSTGFLGKVLVEKILRIQPDIKKIFILIRAVDVQSAKQRVRTEVIEREIFQVLKERHGHSFEDFVEQRICPLAGDITLDNFSLCDAELSELLNEIDIIINCAATTNFHERYDVAFKTNVIGIKHICEFANKCNKLKMLLHVSTAYVTGEQEGIILEEPFLMGETLKEGAYLDIESELHLLNETMTEVKTKCASESSEKRTMKELGLKRAREFGWPNTYAFTKAMGEMVLGHLRGDYPVIIIRPSIVTSILWDPVPGWMEGIRTIDSVIIGYAKQTLPFFLADLKLIMDVIPADMVVNAMMVVMAAHSEKQGQIIYNVTSSLRNPAPYSILSNSVHRYFRENPPCIGKNGQPIQLSRMRFFRTAPRLRTYMIIKYKLPLEILHLLNIAFCGVHSGLYDNLSRKYRYIIHLIDLYAPYSLFRGCFDDRNTEMLRAAVNKERHNKGEYEFCFDPKVINWDDYFYRIHVPGVMKYLYH